MNTTVTAAVMRSLYRSGVRGVKGRHALGRFAQGLREKAEEFRKGGGEIYRPA